MHIIKGRGNKRQILAILPTGEIARTYAKDQPEEYKIILHNLCTMLGIN